MPLTTPTGRSLSGPGALVHLSPSPQAADESGQGLAIMAEPYSRIPLRLTQRERSGRLGGRAIVPSIAAVRAPWYD